MFARQPPDHRPSTSTSSSVEALVLHQGKIAEMKRGARPRRRLRCT